MIAMCMTVDASSLLADDTAVEVLTSIRGCEIRRNFRKPGSVSTYKKIFFFGSGCLAVSNERIVGYRGGARLINLPWTDGRAAQVQFSILNSSILVVKVDPKLFNPTWSGRVEYHFDLGNHAHQWLNRIQHHQQKCAVVVGVPAKEQEVAT